MELARRTGLSRNTVRAALRAIEPPRYARASTGSKLDPFKEIHRLLAADPKLPGVRVRELLEPFGCTASKTIVDDYLRDPRGHSVSGPGRPRLGPSQLGSCVLLGIGRRHRARRRAGPRKVTVWREHHVRGTGQLSRDRHPVSGRQPSQIAGLSGGLRRPHLPRSTLLLQQALRGHLGRRGRGPVVRGPLGGRYRALRRLDARARGGDAPRPQVERLLVPAL